MSKLIIRSKFSCSTVFFLFIDILLKLKQQIVTCFCKFNCNSVILKWACCDFWRNKVVLPTTGRLNIVWDRRGRREMWSYSTFSGKCSIHYAYRVSALWCSQIWLHCSYWCTYQYIIPKVTQANILKFRSRVHKYASRLTSTLQAELFCSCKRRKFIGQNKVKILSFQVKKLVALVITIILAIVMTIM